MTINVGGEEAYRVQENVGGFEVSVDDRFLQAMKKS